MAGSEVGLASFRRLAQLLTLASVLATVAGFYAGLKGAWALAVLALAAGIGCLYAVQRLSIRASVGSEDVLVFVTKSDCSLCDEARALLPGLVRETPFRVEEVSVESQRFLRRHFRTLVPVLLWQGEELARLRWDYAAVRQRLMAILGRRSRASGQQSP